MQLYVEVSDANGDIVDSYTASDVNIAAMLAESHRVNGDLAVIEIRFVEYEKG